MFRWFIVFNQKRIARESTSMRSLLLSLIVIVSHAFNSQPLAAQTIRYTSIPETNSFVLVIDVSGSMAGAGIAAAREGVASFLKGVRPGDEVGLITFGSTVTVLAEIGTSPKDLNRKMGSLRASGATKLYDALAMAWKELRHKDTRATIVYLTDGRDTGSNFLPNNLRSMFQGSSIYVYGIGISSQLDEAALGDISRATGGDFQVVSDGDRQSLHGIYTQILTSYYQKYPASGVKSKGALLVRSIPSRKEVSIDGQRVGLTPLIRENMDASNVEVTIRFAQDRIWKAPVEIRPGNRAILDAREAGALRNIWFLSRPHDAAVFFDGEFVGNTATDLLSPETRRWVKKAKANPSTLKLIGLKPGMHRLEVIGLPDFDYGPEQKMAIDILLEKDEVIHFDVFKNRLTMGSGFKLEGLPREDPLDGDDFMK